MRQRKARPQGQRRRPPLSEMRACGPKDVINQALAAYGAGLTEHESCVLCGRAEPELIGIFFVPIKPGHVTTVTYGLCQACKDLPESLDKAQAAVILQMEADIAAQGGGGPQGTTGAAYRDTSHDAGRYWTPPE